MYNKLTKSLTILGFSNIDIEIYKTVLSLPNTNILKIHQQTGIDRRKVVTSIKELTNAGLVSKSLDNKINTTDPTRIIALLEFKMYEIKKESIQAKEEIDKIKFDHQSTSKKVKFYDRHTDYILLFNSMLETTDAIYHIGDEKSFIDIVGKDYFKLWLNKRVKKGIKAFDLTFDLSDILDLNIPNLPNTFFGILPKDTKLDGSILCWDDKVAIFSSKVTKVIVIEDMEFAKIFVQLWSMVNQLNIKKKIDI